MTSPYHNIPYPTEAERLEARRRTYRESKLRAKARRGESRTARAQRINALLDQVIQSGLGPASRRMDILAILDRGRR